MVTKNLESVVLGDKGPRGDFASVLLKGVTNAIADEIREGLRDAVLYELELIAESALPDGQSIQGADVDVQYDVQDGQLAIDCRVVGGFVTGTAEVPVQSHTRGSSEVSRHTRTMENQAVWKLSDGEFVTLNSIPQSLLQEAIDRGMQRVMGG